MTRRAGLAAGLALFTLLLLLPPPPGLDRDAWTVAALALLMAVWWLTEALPITVTAFLPFVVLPLAGVATAQETAADYYSPILFLVLGGAIVALAIEKAGLHGRIARWIAARGGSHPRGLVLAFAAATAFVSMLVSNTATALIMMPIALALLKARGPIADTLGAGLALAVAYGASIGGLGTLVGSPTNAIAAGLIDRTLGIKLSFLDWALFGVPIVLLGVPLAAVIINRVLVVPTTPLDREAVLASIGAPGALTVFERRLIPVLVALVTAWVALPLLAPVIGFTSPDDGIIAIVAASLLFILPAGNGGPMLDWPDTARAPWDIILMFGGGLALAAAITDTGLAKWLGLQLQALGGLPVWALALLLTALVVLVTEFASNVATASGFLPVVAGVVLATGVDPLLLAVPAAFAASWGFMLPSGTGPNAIAFASGEVTIGQMARAGLLLDIAGIPLIVAVAFAVAG